MKPTINATMVIAIVFLASVTQAYVYIKPDAKSPDQEGHCYDDALKILVPVNEVRQRPERCEQMSCGSDYSLQIAGCGVIAVGPGMILSQTDYSKPYPECCPHLVMSGENMV
ncbi:uncharacterized protein LOC128729155 [Anopheles nili]|uniref:uncharacterized protein LOC128729155 n=1 Tax=Anopheles nili TaxID=185578 RepID=UPI00237BE90A|nr:uncharacterized protein LOC128729155 [Anopheles nili]